MPKTLQFRRASTASLSSVTGAEGELFVDTSKDTVVVMDGSTAGGFPLARESALSTLTPTTRTITINGNTQSLSSNVSFTVSAGSNYGNSNVAAYLPTYSGNIANVRLGTSGILTFADGTTQTTASQPLTYSTATFTGNGFAANFTITGGRTVDNIFVFVDGSCFTPNVDYSLGGVNNATLSFITQGLGAATWSVSSTLGTGRTYLAGAGTQSAGLAFGGEASGKQAATEEYDGSSWASGGSLATARSNLAGCGLQTAGLAFGGIALAGNTSETEEYDGSAWALGGALAATPSNHSGCGTQTAGLAFGGSNRYMTEEYNGTSWASGGSLNFPKRYSAAAGTQTAGLGFGGYSSGVLSATEEYDGSAWSTGGALNAAKGMLAGFGTQTAGVAFGGQNGSFVQQATTEEYNGSTWSSANPMNTARKQLAGAGVNTAGLGFGGYSSTNNRTEEYTAAVVSVPDAPADQAKIVVRYLPI